MGPGLRRDDSEFAASVCRTSESAGACCANPLVDRHRHYARPHHPESARGGDGKIDDAPANERAAVVDAALDGTPAIADRQYGAHGVCPVRTGHAAAASAVVGGET